MSLAPHEVLRIRLGYQDVETFVERFAANVTRGGVFLASRTPRPVGDTFRFEIALAGGPTMLSGTGRVTWIREFDPAAPRNPHGMGVQFLGIDDYSMPMLNRLVEARDDARTRRRSAIAPPRGASESGTREGTENVRAGGRLSRAMSAVPEQGVSEEGVSEQSIARALDYARSVGTRADNDLDALLATPAGAGRPANIDEALEGLAEFLRPRTKSGQYRPKTGVPDPKPDGNK